MSNRENSLWEKVREVAYKHALINAVKHNGKADVKAVTSKVFGEVPEIRKSVREYIQLIQQVVEEVNKLSLEEQIKTIRENWPELLEEKKEEVKEKRLPPLPNAEMGKVVTRFAPNPDYTIHLGNARPALLSYWYAEQYRGEMILRFEDTDPRIKSPYPEAYQAIKEDLRWLGVRWGREYIQSLRMEIFYELAKELIARRGAYIDKCPDKEFRKLRSIGKACPHRNLPVETQLEEFDKMLQGYYGEGEAVLRVKTDLNHPDPSVRDWVAMRIIDTSKTPHPVVGDKYVVWPTYNFAAAVDDHLMGVTHVLRAKEHISNTVKQSYLYNHMGWKYPEAIHFGRLSLEGFILSKSKMRKMIIDLGIDAYRDPRLGTLSGLRRRGIVREALWEIIREVGIRPVDAKISYVNLAAINRALIDPVANRYMAVEDPVPVVLEGLEKEIKAKIPVHPSKPDYYEYSLKDGSLVYLSSNDVGLLIGKPVRLLGVANFVLRNTPLVSSGKLVLQAEFHSLEHENAKKLGAPIVQWVPDGQMVEVEMLTPHGTTLRSRRLLAEQRLASEKEGAIVQFYRLGFARIDRIGENRVTCIFAHE